MTISLRHRYTDHRLTIYADAEARKELAELAAEKGADFGCDDVMNEVFEHLLCNSELSWADAMETGDLTAAPMLALRDQNYNVLDRWAFMDYQITSPQQRLLECGRCIFTQ